MSRKSKRNRPPVDPAAAEPAIVAGRSGRRGLVAGVVVALLVGLLAAYLLSDRGADGGQAPGGELAAALASVGAPTLGESSARVHVVEFLDPACETCAQFYPVVKQLIEQHPGRIRLSVRHVAFHEGAEFAVRALEASRAQDRYWQTLETLLATQARWAPHHTVQPDLVLAALEGSGLDLPRLRQDMESAEVIARAERDRADAMAARVTATPEYFVNGRPLPSFGYEQLLTLVQQELDQVY